MLDALCGNKNVQKILLFLFVNQKCYGAQLQRLLNTALTPLQNALARLEKGGVIASYCEGKTRLYQFNPSFPLLSELEALLKKAYTLLSPQEKKMYSLLAENQMAGGSWQKGSVLLQFWERLAKVSHLTMNAKTRSQEKTGWNGKGKGEVAVVKENDHVLIFQEKGLWQLQDNQEISFTNVFRWTLDKIKGIISLEHLRLGPNHPVFLFHLAPTNAHLLSSLDSHLCEADVYFSQIFFDRYGIKLMWRVIGPKKNEEMEYYYF